MDNSKVLLIAILIFVVGIIFSAINSVSASSICSGSPVDCNTHNLDYNSCVANPKCLPMDEGMNCNTWMSSEMDCLLHASNGCEGNYNWDNCQYYFWDENSCNLKAGCQWTTEYTETCSGNYELGDEYPDCNGLNYTQCNDPIYSGCSWSGSSNSFCSGNIYVFQGCNPSPSFGSNYFAGCSNNIMPSSSCEELNETDCPTQEGCFWNVTEEVNDTIPPAGTLLPSGGSSGSGGCVTTWLNCTTKANKNGVDGKYCYAPLKDKPNCTAYISNITIDEKTFKYFLIRKINYTGLGKVSIIYISIENNRTFYNEQDFKQFANERIFSNGTYNQLSVTMSIEETGIIINKNYTLDNFPLKDDCLDELNCFVRYNNSVIYSDNPATNWKDGKKNISKEEQSHWNRNALIVGGLVLLFVLGTWLWYDVIKGKEKIE